MIGLNAYDLVQRVRGRIHDLDSRIYADAEILSTADDCCRTLWDVVRTAGENYGLGREDVAVASFTTVQTDAIEYQLPYYVGDIQNVEALTVSGSSAESTPVLAAGMEDMNVGRFDAVNGLRWVWTGGQSGIGVLQIRGPIAGYTSIRFWFVRQWGPLCFGMGTTGGGASASTLIVDSSPAPTGGFKARNGLYTGQELEVYADSGNPTNVGQVARITAHTGSTFTLSPALPATTSDTTAWALMLPTPAAGNRLLVELTTLELLRRSGNDEEVAMTMALIYGTASHPGLIHEFEQHIRMRSSGEPRRITNSRVYRR